MPQLPLPPDFFPVQGCPNETNPETSRQAGTTPLEIWYAGLACQGVTSAAVVRDSLRAFPIVCGRDGIIDSIGFRVVTGVANAVARVGIYNSNQNNYPNALLFDGGEKDCSVSSTTHTTSISPKIFLKAGLYWGVAVAGVADPNVVLGVAGSYPTVMGNSTTLGANPIRHLAAAFAYAALPATFPAGGSGSGANPFAVWIRYSQ